MRGLPERTGAGRLPAEQTAHFPLDVQAATVGDRPPLPMDKLERRVAQLAEFIVTHPGLVPAGVGSPEFLVRLPMRRPVGPVREVRLRTIWPPTPTT